MAIVKAFSNATIGNFVKVLFCSLPMSNKAFVLGCSQKDNKLLRHSKLMQNKNLESFKCSSSITF